MVNILRSQLKVFSIVNRPSLITKACIAVSWVLIHSASKNQWPGFFSEMIVLAKNQLTRDDDPSQVIDTQWTFLELMKSAADEAKLCGRVDGTLHDTAMVYLRQHASEVLNNCLDLLKSTQSVAIRQQAIQAINAWAELDPRTTDEIFHVLDTLFQAASAYPNAITELNYVFEAIQSCLANTNLNRYPTALNNAIQRISTLRPIVEKCLELNDEDSLSALISFLVALADDRSALLYSNEPAGLEIASIVCRLMQTVDTYLVSTLVEFWQHMLQQLPDVEDPERMKLVYRPIIVQVAQIIHQRAQYPLDDDEDDLEERDSVARLRSAGGETLLLVQSYALSEDCLRMFYEVLDGDIRAIQSGNTDRPSYLQRCRSVEATVHFLAVLAEGIPESETVYVPRILDSLSMLPEDIASRKSALTFIGSLGMWLSHQHEVHPEYGAKIASYIIPSIVDENLSQKASEAMRDLAREAPQALLPHLGGLLSAIQNSLFQMPPQRRSLVIMGLSYVIGLLDFASSSNLFLEIARSLCSRMEEIAKLPTLTHEALLSLVCELNSLGLACTPLNDDSHAAPHPFTPALRASWPLVEQLAAHFSHLEPVRRAILKAIKSFIQALPRDEMREFLRGVLNIFVSYTKIDPHNPPLREVSLLISRFETRPEGGLSRATSNPHLICTNQQDINDICQGIQALSTVTLAAIQATEGYSPQVHCFLFMMLSLASKRIPECLCRNQEFFMLVMTTAIKGLLETPDRKAFEALRKFLHGIYTFEDPQWRPALLDVLAKCFSPLLHTLLRVRQNAFERSVYTRQPFDSRLRFRAWVERCHALI